MLMLKGLIRPEALAGIAALVVILLLAGTVSLVSHGQRKITGPAVPAAYVPAATPTPAILDTSDVTPPAPPLSVQWSGLCVHTSARDGSQMYYKDRELGIRSDGVLVTRERKDWQ